MSTALPTRSEAGTSPPTMPVTTSQMSGPPSNPAAPAGGTVAKDDEWVTPQPEAFFDQLLSKG